MTIEESYRTLRIKPGSTPEETRQAYLKLVKFFHPDRHQASPGLLRKATEETKKLNLAYERISKLFGPGKPSSSPKRRTPSRAKGPGQPPKTGEAFTLESCGIKLNWVAPGRFQMGSPGNEAGRSEDEGPQTDVTISRGFWLGAFPVTQDEWKIVTEETTTLNPDPSFFKGPRLPVEQVSWDDCQNWLRALNSLEDSANRLPQDYEYRLPTEAEWELACRAGTSTRFHFGHADENLINHAWFTGNSSGHTHPVGEKKPSPWGFHDMHGNVWEWCADRYGGPLPGGSVADPKGPALGLNCIFRGGSWGVVPARCRCAYRVWNRPGYRDYTVGFRLALAPLH